MSIARDVGGLFFIVPVLLLEALEYFIYFLPIPFHSVHYLAVAWGAGPFFLDPFLDKKPRPKEAKLEVLLSH